MAVIMFKVRAGLDEGEQRRLLENIKTLPGIASVQAVREGAKNPSLRRLHYARLKQDAAPGESLAALRELSDVEQADLPAQRGLM